jgi:hypothetical protein
MTKIQLILLLAFGALIGLVEMAQAQQDLGPITIEIGSNQGHAESAGSVEVTVTRSFGTVSERISERIEVRQRESEASIGRRITERLRARLGRRVTGTGRQIRITPNEGERITRVRLTWNVKGLAPTVRSRNGAASGLISLAETGRAHSGATTVTILGRTVSVDGTGKTTRQIRDELVQKLQEALRNKRVGVVSLGDTQIWIWNVPRTGISFSTTDPGIVDPELWLLVSRDNDP